jgi:hypothetical protein
MGGIARVSFSIEPFEGVFAITPIVNETPLTDMVASFEREQNFEPAGGYGGLVPEWFNYGPLDRYFLGDFEQNSYFAKMDRVYLLGCGACGEVGCWPLKARINASSKTVTWDCFEQEHRRERDYSAFGPFVFDIDQYRKGVAALCADLSARVPRSD